MKKFYVYIHLFPNGKRYVGCTRMQRVKDRFGHNGYNYRFQSLIYNVIKYYGWENIKHIVYEVETVEEMYYLEKYLIAYYNTMNRDKGYNRSIGGEGGAYGYKFTPEQIEHQRQTHLGLKYGPETIEKHKTTPNSGWFKKGQIPHNKGKESPYRGIPKKEETRRKMSESAKKPKKVYKWRTPDGREIEMCINAVHHYHPDWTRIE